MRKITVINGNEIETTLTRDEIISLHREMVARNKQGADLLSTIRGECFDLEARELDARLEWNEYQQDRADKGLVSLVNKSTELMPVADIVERCSAILARHHGFKDGVLRTEDKQGVRDVAEEKELMAQAAERARLIQVKKDEKEAARLMKRQSKMVKSGTYAPAWADKMN
jgi:hypothetical protein